MFKKLIPIILTVAILLSACNLPTSTNPGNLPEDVVIQTKAAQTVEALSTLFTKEAPGSTLTNPANSTPSPFPTLPSTVTAVPSSIPTVFIPTTIPCDRLKFITETVPDGSSFAAGATFTKTWTLQNTGTCTWDTNYKLIFNSGDAMGAPASGTSLTSVVPPGGTIIVSVNLTAPTSLGNFKGNFFLANASGARFGFGDSANLPFWVAITVGATPTSSTFAVTSSSLAANPSSYNGSCASPVTITFSGAITTNRSGTVQYHFIRSDGATGAVQTLTYSSAATVPITTTWSLGSPGTTTSGWIQVYIDDPNHQALAQAAFTVICTP